ncbi:DUF2949 domain-containing protein [Pleurocapsales cyanobacterium LEGE 06147]|nr:DUF2949 domain-containing protein [Pleurocapsales cyanobacterium LEGE 06147]
MSKKSKIREQLISFLHSELAVPDDSITFASKNGEQDPNILSVILWQYGLLTLEQLEQVFNWLETA